MVEIIYHAKRSPGTPVTHHSVFCKAKQLPSGHWLVALADFQSIHIRHKVINEIMADIHQGKHFLEFYSTNPLKNEPDKMCALIKDPYYDKHNKMLFGTLVPQGPFGKRFITRMADNKLPFGVGMKNYYVYRGEEDIETLEIRGFRITLPPKYR